MPWPLGHCEAASHAAAGLHSSSACICEQRLMCLRAAVLYRGGRGRRKQQKHGRRGQHRPGRQSGGPGAGGRQLVGGCADMFCGQFCIEPGTGGEALVDLPVVPGGFAIPPHSWGRRRCAGHDTAAAGAAPLPMLLLSLLHNTCFPQAEAPFVSTPPSCRGRRLVGASGAHFRGWIEEAGGGGGRQALDGAARACTVNWPEIDTGCLLRVLEKGGLLGPAVQSAAAAPTCVARSRW